MKDKSEKKLDFQANGLGPCMFVVFVLVCVGRVTVEIIIALVHLASR